MSFFDDKEEVIKIELTGYGKYLLSKGKFSPKYYSFFDDDILYDSEYSGIKEKQNDSQIRILSETPYLKPQGNFSSVLDDNNRLNEVAVSDSIMESVQKKKSDDQLPYPVGTSDVNSNYAPSWTFNVASGRIRSCQQNIAGNQNGSTSYSFLNIPQINMSTGKFNISVGSLDESRQEESLLFTTTAGDDILYSLDNVFNVFEIVENNVEDKKENFMMEVFIEEDNSDKKVWKQLFFRKNPTNIKNNILLDETLFEDYNISQEVDPTMVEHYFDIGVDTDAIPDMNKNSPIYGSDITLADQPFGDKC